MSRYDAVGLTKKLIIKYVESAIYPFKLREIFNQCVVLFHDPKIHNAFFERIHFLENHNGPLEEFEKKALADLREDLEEEIRTKAKYHEIKQARPAQALCGQGRRRVS